jgi:serine/threonine-protein kinase
MAKLPLLTISGAVAVLHVCSGSVSAAVTDISAQSSTTCAVVDGAAWCWGWSGPFGLLGNQVENTSSARPLKVKGLENVSAISVGGHVCAIASGAVWCWGDNRWGQLGIGTRKTALWPTAVKGLPAPVTAISAGQFHTCAIAAGEVWCWGHGIYGQLGNGQRRDVAHPVRVTGLGAGVSAIATSSQASCAITAGVVKCWGLNTQSVLGAFKKADSALPVAIADVKDATAISCGYAKCCAIGAGAVKCWGDMGSVADPSAPPVSAARTIDGISNAVAVAVDNHVCAISDRRLMCWGDNQYGQTGGRSPSGSPFAVRRPTKVKGLTGVTHVAIGLSHTCAIADRKAYCWGNYFEGDLGTGKQGDGRMFDPSLNETEPQPVKW